jgi:hypothetical protein
LERVTDEAASIFNLVGPLDFRDVVGFPKDERTDREGVLVTVVIRRIWASRSTNGNTETVTVNAMTITRAPVSNTTNR